jgi:sodium/potassium/calcium exchanger 6
MSAALDSRVHLPSRSLKDDSDDCNDVRSVPESEQCQYVYDNCGAITGIFNYMALRYCKMPHAPAFVYILLISWLLLLFVILGDTADTYFTAALERITEALELTPNVAGVTFLALGNGAPDISSIVAAVVVSGASDIGIGEPIGSGCFITTVIMGVVAFVSDVRVTRRPFLRDVLCYLGAVIFAFFIALDGKINLVESIAFLIYYFVYVFVVVLGRMIYQRWKKRSGANPELHNTAHVQNVIEHDLAKDQHAPHRHVAYMVHGQALEEEIEQEERDEERERVLSEASSPNERTALTPRSSAVRSPASGTSGRSGASSQPMLDAVFEIEKSPQPDHEHPKRVAPHGAPFYVVGWVWFMNAIEWDEKNMLEKCIFPLIAPFRLMFNLTIPQVEEGSWSKEWACVATALSPLPVMFAVNVFTFMINDEFPLTVLIFLLLLPISVFAYWKLPKEDEPRPAIMLVFIFFCFGMSIVWIYLIANELVAVLQAIGIMLGVSPTLMGLTVLAWGNSVGDFVADVIVSRNGYPQMAVAAIYAGPLLNLLLGVGIAFTIVTAMSYPEPAPIPADDAIYISFITLFISLGTALIVIPLNKFHCPRWYGAFLLVLYAVCIIFSVLYSFGVMRG